SFAGLTSTRGPSGKRVLEYLVGIAIGLWLAWSVPARERWRAIVVAIGHLVQALARLARRPFEMHPASAQKPDQASPAAIAPLPAPAEGPPPGNAPSLAQQLGALTAEFEPVLSSAAHSRDFYENASFRAAIALLADTAVPLDTVIAYAVGHNWAQ